MKNVSVLLAGFSLFLLCNAVMAASLINARLDFDVDENAGSITVAANIDSCNQDQGCFVDYATRDGTAVAGIDYVATSGQLFWNFEESGPKTYTVSIIDNNLLDGDRVFAVIFSAVEGGGVDISGRPSDSITIRDDEVACSFDPTIPDADPLCPAACPFDPTIPETDAACIDPSEPCPSNPDIPAGDVSCVVTEQLLEFADSEGEASVARVIGDVCPKNIAEANFQRDCNALVGAAFADDADTATALGQITPTEAAVANDSAVNSVGTQIDNVAGRITALRRGASGFSLAGLNFEIDDTRISGRQIASFYDAAGGGAAADSSGSGFSRLGGFVSGDIIFGDKDATENEEGFDFNTYGITVGIDYRFSDKLIGGLAFGYSDSKTDIDDNGGNLDADAYSAILYGSYFHNDRFFVDGSLSFGRNNFDQKRNVVYALDDGTNVNQKFSADFDGDQFAVALSAGYQYSKDALTFTPSARLQYINADVDGYSEDSGSNPVADGSGWGVEIDDQQFTSFTLSLGGQVSYAVSQSWGVLLPYAGFEWVNEFDDNDDDVTGRFTGDPTATTFFLPTDQADSNYFNFSLGMSAQFTGGASGFLGYEQVLGYDDLKSYRVNAGFRYEF